MGDPLYAFQKIRKAIGVLVTHPGRIRERLIAACNSGLFVLAEADFPSDALLASWRGIRTQVAGMGTVGQHSAFEVAVNVLPEETASEVASNLMDLAAMLDGWLDENVRRQWAV
jgi:hypothetical protein